MPAGRAERQAVAAEQRQPYTRREDQHQLIC